MAKNLSAVSSFLENHYSRDKVFRTAQFSALLLSGLSQQRLPVLSEKLVRIYQQFSHVRLVLRLADDLPMLAYTLKSAFARDKSDSFLHWSTLLSNISIQLYYPLEHLAWLSDSSLVSFSSGRLWRVALLCWVVYSIIKLLQTVYNLRAINAMKNKKGSGSQSAKHGVDVGGQRLQRRQSVITLGLVQYICDLLCGLHWLGWGPLSNKLPTSLLGLLGTISSVVQLYQHLTRH
ncbi:peroxisomal membrane protein 11C-like [Dysidea avara]|uniref:peroxisomal membrane protein 11C-like n=1 Tax=Dysidea avara TaxID=196820 RepID=UPI00331BE6C9